MYIIPITNIDLSQFCSREEMRAYLLKPASQGDWTYATNGHIMVRVPRLVAVPEVEHFPYKQCVKMFTDFSLTEPIPLGQYDWPEQTEDDCTHCDGRGKEHDCPACECTCEWCDGAGIAPAMDNISAEISGIPFQAKYIKMLAALPSIEVPAKVHPSNPMPFRFEGGQGLLMPRKTECTEHLKPI